MVLAGKLSTEIEIKTPADKFFDLFANQLHHVQNLCERVHETKILDGDDWHGVGKSVKHWTCVIDGKSHTCQETIEEFDAENKKIVYKLFGGDINQKYKLFRLILEVIDNHGTSHDVVKWTVEYEKKQEEIDPPNGYVEYLNKSTRDIDVHFVKA